MNMCIGKDLFLNRRTRQSGYIEFQKGKRLSQTQLKDLVQVAYWVKCKYHFAPKDIADFLGVPQALVEECLKQENLACLDCSKKLKKLS